MQTSLFNQFAEVIRNSSGNAQASELRIASEGDLACYYAPFDWVNTQARVVLVGITPGEAQARAALLAARRELERGGTAAAALVAGKLTGAFSGPLRSNLVQMLDHIGIARWLRIQSTDELFGAEWSQLQTTSVLQYPVFKGGENYNGAPNPLSSSFLRGLVLEHFLPLLRALPQAAYVPLGPVPTKILEWLARDGHIDSRRLLAGLPHPSGANSERIAYFLGNKQRDQLSMKTDPDKLDAARAQLVRAVTQMQ